MPLITLDIPQHKMPIVKEFIQVTGLKEKSFENSFGLYARTNANTRQNLPTSFYGSSRGWEYFHSELEFE